MLLRYVDETNGFVLVNSLANYLPFTQGTGCQSIGVQMSYVSREL